MTRVEIATLDYITVRRDWKLFKVFKEYLKEDAPEMGMDIQGCFACNGRRWFKKWSDHVVKTENAISKLLTHELSAN